MTGYWIKFYCEVIDDPKMAVLPDRLWRRFYELCAMCGKMQNKDGLLPNTDGIAWTLRMNIEEVDLDLHQLAELGLIRKVDTGWLVINFAKRQEPVRPAEKMRQYRERQHKQQYYDDMEPVTDAIISVDDSVTRPVTNPLPMVTQIKIKNKNREEEEEEEKVTRAVTTDPFSDMQLLLETLIGYPITPVPKEIEAIDRYLAQGITEADIRAALAFYRDNGRVARGAAALEKSVMYAKAQRLQTQNAQAPPDGRKPQTTIEELGYKWIDDVKAED